MKIELFQDYRGRITGDALLTKGVQEISDVIGTYLVNKGRAVQVSDTTPIADEPIIPDDTPTTMTYADVTEKARQQSIKDSQPKRKRK